LAFEADELAGRGDAGFCALVVGTHEDLAATDAAEVDGLNAFAFLAFGSDFRPGDVREREGVEEGESVTPVVEVQFGSDVETAEAGVGRVDVEAKALNGGVGAVLERGHREE
jgi:hypothetical protein